MEYTHSDVVRRLREYPALACIKRQLELELSLLSADDVGRDKLSEHLLPIATELRRTEFYIELLSEKCSKVIWLLFIDGLTHKEAAARLEIDEKTVARRKERGLSELAAMYSRLP
jgi:DNA-directed RNA polymerase specialized sigma24 family protein